MRSQVLPFIFSSPADVASSRPPANQTCEKLQADEERMIVDERSSQRPAEVVEERLSQKMGASCLGVSQLRLKTLISARTSKS